MSVRAIWRLAGASGVRRGARAGARFGAQAAPTMVEPPFFEDAVAAGDAAAGRRAHPASIPSIVSYDGTEKKPGSYGGTLRMLGGSAKDTRLMVIYGYARLVAYTPNFEIVPDIAESVDVEEGRRLHLPSSARATNGRTASRSPRRISASTGRTWRTIAEVSRFGPPKELLVDGEKPVVEFPDATTVRYTLVEAESLFPAGARRRAAGRDLPARRTT